MGAEEAGRNGLTPLVSGVVSRPPLRRVLLPHQGPLFRRPQRALGKGATVKRQSGKLLGRAAPCRVQQQQKGGDPLWRPGATEHDSPNVTALQSPPFQNLDLPD